MILAVVALFTPLGPLVLALVALKMATSIALYATQWPSPETGQTIGLVDVAMDGTDLLGAAGDVVIGRAGGDGRQRGDAADRPAASAADAAGRVDVVRRPTDVVDDLPVIAVSRGRHPQSAQHVDDAQQAGHPAVLTIDRAGAEAQRRRVAARQPDAARTSTATSTHRPCSTRAAPALACGASITATTVAPAPRWAIRLGACPTALESDWWSPTDARTSHPRPAQPLVRRRSASRPARSGAAGRVGRRAERAARRPQRLLRVSSRRCTCCRPATPSSGHRSSSGTLRTDGARRTARLADGLFFFAEDVFGGQFAIRGEQVVTFDPETGEIEAMRLEHRGLGRPAAGRLRVPDRPAARREWQTAQRRVVARRAARARRCRSCSAASSRSATCTPLDAAARHAAARRARRPAASTCPTAPRSRTGSSIECCDDEGADGRSARHRAVGAA